MAKLEQTSRSVSSEAWLVEVEAAVVIGLSVVASEDSAGGVARRGCCAVVVCGKSADGCVSLGEDRVAAGCRGGGEQVVAAEEGCCGEQ